MTKSFPRRAAAAAATLLLAALLPWSVVVPATADTSEGVPGVPRAEATAVSMGGAFGCVIVTDGSVRCWGDGSVGALAQGNTQDVGDDPGESTVRVPLSRPATAVVAGSDNVCAILDTGELRCWGHGFYGQLAQGNQDNIGDTAGESTVAIDLGGRPATAVAVGSDHICALTDTGQVRCWGRNDQGQLGQGNTDDWGDDPGETTTLPVPMPRPAVAISASLQATCAILDTGAVHCWGSGEYGKLMHGNAGDVGNDSTEHTVPLAIAPHTALTIAGGERGFCAIYDDHLARCWGGSSEGELGLGRDTPYGDDPGETNVPALPLPAGRTAVALSAGGHDACAVLDNGELRCWGDGIAGQLGQGNGDDVGESPGESTVAVSLDGPVRAVSVGGSTICAVTPSGLRCWGFGSSGRLGNGSSANYGDSPGQVPALLPPIKLGGLSVGRDTDGDGVRDAVDACPTVSGPLADGCVPAPEAVLKGKKVLLHTVLAKKKATAKCPGKAEVAVKTKSKHGRVKVTKLLKTRTVATGCLVTGKVRLPAKPKKTAAVKATVSGKKLQTKRLVAVRQP